MGSPYPVLHSWLPGPRSLWTQPSMCSSVCSINLCSLAFADSVLKLPTGWGHKHSITSMKGEKTPQSPLKNQEKSSLWFTILSIAPHIHILSLGAWHVCSGSFTGTGEPQQQQLPQEKNVSRPPATIDCLYILGG